MLGMPTILRVGHYRFFFYSNENNEPPHIHIEKDDKTAKFWLENIGLASNDGFTGKELKDLHVIIHENQIKLINAYKEYH